MSRGFYAAASAMMSDMTRFDVIANNLANVNTTGYKRSQSVHHDFREGFIQRIHNEQALAGVSESGKFAPRAVPLPPAPVGVLGTGTMVQSTWNDFQHGSLEKTEGPFDVALQSEEFFVVQNPNERLLDRIETPIIQDLAAQQQLKQTNPEQLQQTDAAVTLG